MEYMKPNILIIDDQIASSEVHKNHGYPLGAKSFLRGTGYLSEGGDEPAERYPFQFSYHSGENVSDSGEYSISAAKKAVASKWPDKNGDRWALVLLDVRFGEDAEFGFRLLEALRADSRFGADLPIVMLTSEDADKREKADDRRATDYFPKLDEKTKSPVRSFDRFQEMVLKNGLVPDLRTVSDLERTPGARRIEGRSLALLESLREARRYALEPKGNRILYGETGVGKTQLAAYIHHYARRKGPYRYYVADSGAEKLMKTELFGEWKGSHSESKHYQPGKIEQAQGGTFFLDEVANLPLEAQQLLLASRERDDMGRRLISRVGNFPPHDAVKEVKIATESVISGAKLLPDHRIAVDVLLLTGTNANLDDPGERRRLNFRDDLHRALGTAIWCPNLNQRREDIPELFRSFILRELKIPDNSEASVEIESAVLDLLRDRDWSQRGNIGDLERLAQYVASQPRITNKIKLHHLPGDILGSASSPAGESASDSSKTVQPVSPEVLPNPEPADNPRPLPTSVAAVQSFQHSGLECIPGALSFAELAHLRERAELLERFAEETRKRDKATTKLGRYQPTEAVSRLLGAHISTQNSKRIIAEIIGAILDTPKYLADAYRDKGLEELRAWAQGRPVLSGLYRYAKGEGGIEDVGKQ